MRIDLEPIKALLEKWQQPGSHMDRAVSQTLLVNELLHQAPALIAELEALRAENARLTETNSRLRKESLDDHGNY